jgi:protocatechuate 3,4-dioxygenase beta subunit
MRHDHDRPPSRRAFVATVLAVLAALVTARVPGARAQGSARPARACDAGRPTPPQTEGPYFKPGAPRRASLVEPGMAGTRIVVEGTVMTVECRPVPGARVDVWQADEAGRYDNRGYRLRGHVVTDEAGRYRVETIVPGGYPGRTRHIHLKVQAPGRRPLTTQLYFPDEPLNRRDGIFDPELIMTVRDTGDGKVASFDFVLA